MADECARMTTTDTAGAILIQWLLIQDIARILDIQFASRSECLSGTAIARRQHAIKHVDAARDSFNQIFGSANTHQVSRLIGGHARRYIFNQFHHDVFLFAYTDPADSITIETHTTPSVQTLAPQIQGR